MGWLANTAMAMALLTALAARCGATAEPTPTITALDFPLRPIRATTTGSQSEGCPPAPTRDETAFPLPRLREAVPKLPYNVWPIIPAQFPLGEPVPISVLVKNASQDTIIVPDEFAYAVVITNEDGKPVSWWLDGQDKYDTVARLTTDESPARLRRRVVPGGTTAYDVGWDQRNLGPDLRGVGPCLGEPVLPGHYLVWVLVPSRPGDSAAVREALPAAPDRLAELGWMVAEPHQLKLGGPGNSCTERIRAEEPRHIEVLKQVKRRYRESFMAIPGGTSLGVGVVRKNGQRITEIGIIVFNDPKLPPQQIDPQGLIPKTLAGCTVTTKTIHPEPAGARGVQLSPGA